MLIMETQVSKLTPKCIVQVSPGASSVVFFVQGHVFEVCEKWSKTDGSGITRCVCLRGCRGWWSQIGEFPRQPGIPNMLNPTGHSENLTSYKLDGSTSSCSWGTGSRSSDVLRLGLFKFHPGLFF